MKPWKGIIIVGNVGTLFGFPVGRYFSYNKRKFRRKSIFLRDTYLDRKTPKFTSAHLVFLAKAFSQNIVIDYVAIIDIWNPVRNTLKFSCHTANCHSKLLDFENGNGKIGGKC